MMSSIERLYGLMRRLTHSTRAVGAIEFALTAPFLILLYVGSYQLMDAISAYRKVTVTARSLSDLSTQNETITPYQVQQIFNASRQIMTPYSTVSASLVIAQISVNHAGVPSITWVCVKDSSPICSTSTPKLKVSDVNLPQNLKIPDSFTIYSQIVFHYTPPIAGTLIGLLNFSDHIFMNPRRSPSVCLNTGSDNSPNCLGQDAS